MLCCLIEVVEDDNVGDDSSDTMIIRVRVRITDELGRN